MALINCPECGNQVSEQAATCPKCGVQIQGASTVKLRFNAQKVAMFGAVTGPRLVSDVSVLDSSGKTLYTGKTGQGNTCILNNITQPVTLTVKVGKNMMTIHGTFKITVQPGKKYVVNSRYGNATGALKDFSINEVEVFDAD